MNMFNNRLFSSLNTIVDLFLLNLLWVLSMFPLITFFPATAALFGVVRKRILHKETDGIFKSFFQLFKENFKQSFGISVLWTVVGLFLYFDYQLIDPSSSAVQLIVYIVLILAILLFSSVSMYLFPIIVHFELGWKYVIRNAFLFSLMNPVLTILLLLILGACIAIIQLYPAAIFLIGSPSAYIIYHLCQRWFNQVVEMR
ncbi:MAG: DUF624 domain-containing protein [Neobacillus sp.]